MYKCSTEYVFYIQNLPFDGGIFDQQIGRHVERKTWSQLGIGFFCRNIFPEGFLALLTYEYHLGRLCKPVELCFCVAFGTIEPLLTAGRTDGNLGIQDVLAVVF